jgi:hypothetical protein
VAARGRRTASGPDQGGKRLELLKEFLPDASRVAILWNAANPYAPHVYASMCFVQASQARLSASLRASAARSAAIRTGVLQNLSRDLVPMAGECAWWSSAHKPQKW